VTSRNAETSAATLPAIPGPPPRISQWKRNVCAQRILASGIDPCQVNLEVYPNGYRAGEGRTAGLGERDPWLDVGDGLGTLGKNTDSTIGARANEIRHRRFYVGDGFQMCAGQVLCR
jgi:hypothetical protein